MKRKLIFLQLNEVSFRLVKKYIDSGASLPGFSVLLDNGIKTTSSEASYELLEPWIQWYSIHTGLTYEQHQVFRLGDASLVKHETIYEALASRDISVAALSPMNCEIPEGIAEFFVPDPWTKAKPDASWTSRFLTSVLQQSVNDNASQRLTALTLVRLCCVLAYSLKTFELISLIKEALRSGSDRVKRALWLDRALFLIFKSMLRRSTPDFSTLFLNGCAHVQHHYLHSSAAVASDRKVQMPRWYQAPNRDPVFESYASYDRMLQEAFQMKGCDILVATGLSQTIYPRPIFYYRLKNHDKFFKDVGIEYASISPRMTRDFLITFHSVDEQTKSVELLRSLEVDGERLFGELDVRSLDVFGVLTYANEISEKTRLNINGQSLRLDEYFVFVALKNGCHQSEGYVAASDKRLTASLTDGQHVAKLRPHIESLFESE